MRSCFFLDFTLTLPSMMSSRFNESTAEKTPEIPGPPERHGGSKHIHGNHGGSSVTIINHPFGNGLYQLSLVIWGMVYYYCTHINIAIILLVP